MRDSFRSTPWARRSRSLRFAAGVTVLVLILATVLVASSPATTLYSRAHGPSDLSKGGGQNPDVGRPSTATRNQFVAEDRGDQVWLPHRASRETSPEEQYQVGVQVAGIDLELPWPVVVRNTVTLSWTQQLGGLLPEIALDGTTVAQGDLVAVGDLQRMDLSFSTTARSSPTDVHEAVVFADPSTRVVLAYHGRDQNPRWISDANTPSSIRDQVSRGADAPFVAGAAYWHAVDRANLELADELGVSILRRPSLAIVTSGPSGMGIDVVLDSVAIKGPLVERWRFMALSGVASSLLEFATLEAVTGQPAVDALRVLAEASRVGIPLATIKDANQIADLEQLSETEEAALRAAAGSGYISLVPVRVVTIGAWSARAWFVVDPKTGSTGAYLSDHRAITRGGFSDAVGAIGDSLTTIGLSLATTGLATAITGISTGNLSLAEAGLTLGIAGLTLAAIGQALNAMTSPPADLHVQAMGLNVSDDEDSDDSDNSDDSDDGDADGEDGSDADGEDGSDADGEDGSDADGDDGGDAGEGNDGEGGGEDGGDAGEGGDGDGGDAGDGGEGGGDAGDGGDGGDGGGGDGGGGDGP